MIDLRSDTVTKPTIDMKKAMFEAEVGDDGRTNAEGRGEDPTVQKLEDISAEKTGHEAALFCISGTMANYIAVLAHGVERGEIVLTDEKSHAYRSEKGLFNQGLLGMNPRFYDMVESGVPDIDDIKKLLENGENRLLLLENTHNSYGGKCITEEQMNNICVLSKSHEIPVHLDGARIFNAAEYLNVDVRQLTSQADSVMFCLSKGLGAPLGSLLCGDREFIMRGRQIRKMLGGSMRQAGVVASAGIVALEKGVNNLSIDHENALYLAENLNQEYLKVDTSKVQTNIVNADVINSGYTAQDLVKVLYDKKIRIQAISDNKVRMVTHKDITRSDIERVVNTINVHFQ